MSSGTNALGTKVPWGLIGRCNKDQNRLRDSRRQAALYHLYAFDHVTLPLGLQFRCEIKKIIVPTSSVVVGINEAHKLINTVLGLEHNEGLEKILVVITPMHSLLPLYS